MKHKIDTVIQILLGIFLLVMGLNKFFNFMPPPELPEAAGQLMQAFAASGYILKMVGVTELLCGLLLVIRRWSAMALLLLAPLSVNLILFHLVLAPSSIAMAAVVAIANLYLLFAYKSKYEPVLRPR